MDVDKIQLLTRKETNMLFKAGTYKHEEGFTIMVTEDGTIMLSPNHPLSLRLSLLFDTTKWKKIS